MTSTRSKRARALSQGLRRAGLENSRTSKIVQAAKVAKRLDERSRRNRAKALRRALRSARRLNARAVDRAALACTFLTDKRKILKRRHAKGMEYAAADPQLQSLVINFMLKSEIASTYGQAAGAYAGLWLRLYSAINLRLRTQAGEGMTLGTTAEYTKIAFETMFWALTQLFPKAKVLNVPLGAAKIAAAFATSYTYGFFWGG